MVEPTAADMTITVPGELHARAEALHAAHFDAIQQCFREDSADNLRRVATTGRELEKTYRELAREFRDSSVLYHALCRARNRLITDVEQYDEWAEKADRRFAARRDAS